MLFHLPHLNLSGIHVPEHFTGIWVQGKPRQPGKSVITLELPISYDRYCCFQHFSKEATEWHLCSPEGLVAIQSDPSQRAESHSFVSFGFRADKDKKGMITMSVDNLSQENVAEHHTAAGKQQLEGQISSLHQFQIYPDRDRLCTSIH